MQTIPCDLNCKYFVNKPLPVKAKISSPFLIKGTTGYQSGKTALTEFFNVFIVILKDAKD